MRFFGVLLVLAVTACAHRKRSESQATTIPATTNGSDVDVPGIAPEQPSSTEDAVAVGAFATNVVIDFSAMPDGAPLPDTLIATDNQYLGSVATNDQQLYMADRVSIKSGALQLLVPGGQTSMPYLGAEVSTKEVHIMHGSITTRAKFSAVAGTCHGLFFFEGDNEEIDIEYLTGMPDVIHYTNQKASDDAKETYAPIKQTVDLTADFHDYRIDWMDGQTTFYFDGVLQNTFTDNVPTVSGPWVWNNWFNGAKTWSGTGPATDSYLQIEKITMSYDVADS